MLERCRVPVWLLLTLPGVSPAADLAPVDFETEVVPLLGKRCVSCHLTGQEQGGLALHPKAAYASLVGVRSQQSELMLVEPGDPARSYLYRKLTNTHQATGGEGEPMPMGAWPLEPAELELMRRWISEGAEGH
jgi:hypothetical protein